jgi:N-acetylmuramoyl-L-alanine amidase
LHPDNQVSGQNLVQSDPAAVVLTGALNVRSGPGVAYGVNGVVHQGDMVSVIGRNDSGSWVVIQTPSGLEGWVNSSYLQINIPVQSLPVVITDESPSPVGIVNTAILNVRSGPGTSFAVIAKLRGGDTVALLGRNVSASWVLIQTSNNAQGWVNGSYLVTNVPISSLPVVTGGEPVPPPPDQPIAIVTTGALNVRTGPGVAYHIIAVLDEGDTVQLLGRNNSGTWVQVKLQDETVGWVNASLVQTSVPVSSLPISETSAPMPTGIVTAGALNVRRGPDVAFEVLTVLQHGESVIIKGRNNSSTWVQVTQGNGTSGWVNAFYLTINVPVITLPVTG